MVKRREPQANTIAKRQPTAEQIEAFASAADGGATIEEAETKPTLDPKAKRDYKAKCYPLGNPKACRRSKRRCKKGSFLVPQKHQKGIKSAN